MKSSTYIFNKLRLRVSIATSGVPFAHPRDQYRKFNFPSTMLSFQFYTGERREKGLLFQFLLPFAFVLFFLFLLRKTIVYIVKYFFFFLLFRTYLNRLQNFSHSEFSEFSSFFFGFFISSRRMVFLLPKFGKVVRYHGCRLGR